MYGFSPLDHLLFEMATWLPTIFGYTVAVLVGYWLRGTHLFEEWIPD